MCCSSMRPPAGRWDGRQRRTSDACERQQALLYVPMAVIWEVSLLALPLVTRARDIRASGAVHVIW